MFNGYDKVESTVIKAQRGRDDAREYNDNDITDYKELKIRGELGGYKTLSNNVRCQFVLERRFMEGEKAYLVAVTNAVDTAGSIYPIDYYLDKIRQPQHTVASALEILIPRLEELSLDETSALKTKCRTLLSGLRLDDKGVDTIIRMIREKEFDKVRLEAKLKEVQGEFQRRDVFDEILPIMLGEETSHAKIIFPYNITQVHWLSGEIKISKDGRNYTVEVYAHDPYGEGIMHADNYEQIRQSIERRIKGEAPEAVIMCRNCISRYGRRQTPGDNVSCGVITAEDIIKLIQGKSLDIKVPYEYGAISLREKHLDEFLPYDTPSRARFIRRFEEAKKATKLDKTSLPASRVDYPGSKAVQDVSSSEKVSESNFNEGIELDLGESEWVKHPQIQVICEDKRGMADEDMVEYIKKRLGKLVTPENLSEAKILKLLEEIEAQRKKYKFTYELIAEINKQYLQTFKGFCEPKYYELIRQVCEKGLEITTQYKTENIKGIYEILFKLADACSQKMDYARNCYLRILQYSRIQNEQEYYSLALNRVGELCLQGKNYSEAAIFYQEVDTQDEGSQSKIHLLKLHIILDVVQEAMQKGLNDIDYISALENIAYIYSSVTEGDKKFIERSLTEPVLAGILKKIQATLRDCSQVQSILDALKRVENLASFFSYQRKYYDTILQAIIDFIADTQDIDSPDFALRKYSSALVAIQNKSDCIKHEKKISAEATTISSNIRKRMKELHSVILRNRGAAVKAF